MAISHPSLLQAISLTLRCDTQEGCRDTKTLLEELVGAKAWLRGLLHDGPRSWYADLVLSAVEIRAQSLFKVSALSQIVSKSCRDVLCSRLKPPRQPLGKGCLAGHGHKQGKGFHEAMQVYPELAINTSSEHHSPSSLMFCCYLLLTHSLCCYFYLLSSPPPAFLQLFMSCITEASQKEDGKKAGDPRKKVMRWKVPVRVMGWAPKSAPHHRDGSNRVSHCSPATSIC